MGRTKKPKTKYRQVDPQTQLKWHFSQASHTLHVGMRDGEKFPNYINSGHLEEHFARFSEQIKKLKVMRDLQTRNTLGFALVNVSTRESADRIIAEMDGTKLCGKFPLLIKYEVEEGSEKPSSHASVSKRSDNPSLGTPQPFEMYVTAHKSFFPDYVTTEDLKQHFSEYKTQILKATMVFDKDGRSQGYGFITFSCEDVAKRAMTEKKGSKMQDKFLLFMKIRKCEVKAAPQKSVSYSAAVTVHKRALTSATSTQPSVKQEQTPVSKSTAEYQLSQANSDTTTVVDQDNPQPSVEKFSKSAATERSKQGSYATAASKKPTKEKHCDVYVGGYKYKLPAHVSCKDLGTHFDSFSCDIVDIKRLNQTKKSGGFEFTITFRSQAAAEAAVKDMDGSALKGKYTLIMAHTNKLHQEIGSSNSPSPPPQAVAPAQKTESAHHIVSIPSSAVSQSAIEQYDQWPQVQPLAPSALVCLEEDEHILDPSCFDPLHSQSEPLWRDVFDDDKGLVTSHYLSAMEFPIQCTVLVGTRTAFPNFVTEEHLTQHFAKFGDKIVDVQIIRNSRKEKPSGGSITFATINAAKNAITEMNGSKLVGRFPLVLECDPTSICQTDPQAKVFTERLKLNSLIHIYPDVVTLVLQTFAVQLNGYWNDSKVITLTGLPEAVYLAKQDIESILFKFVAEKIQFTHPSLLFESAKQKLQTDRISVYLQFDASLKKLCVCAFSDLYLSNALEVLQKEPFEKVLTLPLGIDLKPIESELKSIQQGHSVMAVTETAENDETTMTVYGFDWDRILSICKELEHLFENTVMKTFTLPLQCTTMQALYLKNLFFEQPTPECKALLESLPARVIKSSNNKVILIGTQRAIKEAGDQILSSPFIEGLVSKTWNFQCSVEFQKQIEEHILQPMRSAYLDVAFVFDKMPSVNTEDGVRPTFSIHIFSLKNKDLEKASERMKDLEPQTQCFPLPQPEAITTAMECFKTTEKKYCTVISPQYKPPAVIIHGLCSNDISASWKDIEEYVGVNYSATEVISLSMCQVKYLKVKHASLLDEVRTTCVVELPSTQADQPLLLKENMNMSIKGSYSAVKEATNTIKTLCSNCFTDSVQLKCKVEHAKIWQKRWDMLKSAKDKESETVIEYTCTPKAKGTISATFVIYGSCKEGIKSAKQALLEVENGKTLVGKYIKLNDAELTALKNGLEQKKIDPVTEFNILLELHEEQKKVEIQAPEPSKKELELAGNEIKSFLDQHTEVSRENRFPDSVLGHMLTSESHSHFHEIIKVAEEQHVSVQPLKTPNYYSLRLKGMQRAVKTVQGVIKSVEEKLSKTIGYEQLVIEPSYSRVLSGEDYAKFNCQLTEELSVVCSYPTQSQQTKIARETRLKSSSGHLLTVQICKGDIIYDKVDVIVNPANEDLTHCGGLALAISQAGGPSIQAESTEHVRLHGRVMPGDAVCLGSGDLPCRSVIHAVGPRWAGGENGEMDCLQKAVLKSLLFAHLKSFGSISLPAIATGIFGVPIEIFSEAVFAAINKFRNMFGSTTLHTIRIVLDSEDKIQVVTDCFDTTMTVSAEEGNPDDSAHVMKQSEATVTSDSTYAEVSTVQTSRAHQAQFQWSWHDGRRFQDYLPIENAKLNQEYALDPNCQCTLMINNTQYEVDFQTMEQTNMQTGFSRKLNRGSIMSSGDALSERTVPTKGKVQWHYMDDSFKYVPYNDSDSFKVEQIYKSGVQRSPLQIHRRPYTFNFKTLLRTNDRTKRSRPIKRTISVSESSKEPVQWYYKNDNHKFVPYTQALSDEIEEIFQGTTLVVAIPIRGRMYMIDCQAMRQIDIKTKHKITIKRQKKKAHGQSDEVQPLTEIVINIRGPKENLSLAKEKIMAKLESMLTTEQILLPPGISEASREVLEKVAKQYGVSVSRDTDTDGDSDHSDSESDTASSAAKESEVVMTLNGPKTAVMEVCGEFWKQIISLQATEHANALAASQAATKVLQFPPEWESQGKTTQLFELQQGTPEWAKVADKFSKTMSGYTITSIKRIQNKYLWQRYEQHKRMMDEKNDARINEMELFHGTHRNCPDKIYDSEEGFDMRHSSDGMWGQANYFAEDAKYSHSYAYHRPDGEHEMFLAKILTGDSYTCGSDSTLRMPPVKQGYQATQVQLGEVRYDTVHGRAQSTEVYMTYSNEKAYPAYIIQYTDDSRSEMYSSGIYGRSVYGRSPMFQSRYKI